MSPVDLAKGEDAVESSNEEKPHELDIGENHDTEHAEIFEPYVGMEFESEDEARKFYAEYARKLGFVVRVMQRRRSGIDGRTLARRLGCNKQGFSRNNHKNPNFGSEKKSHCSAREGCAATILVKMEKSGKWVVTRFLKEHNHPLVVTGDSGFSSPNDKEKKIEELTMELEREDELCAAYRKRLIGFMNDVEEQTEGLSSKVRVIVENLRKLESEFPSGLNHI